MTYDNHAYIFVYMLTYLDVYGLSYGELQAALK